MMESMVADCVSGPDDSIVEVGITACVVGHHEECGAGTGIGKHIEEQGSGFGNRPVVEAEKNRRLLASGAKDHIAPESDKP